MHVIKTVMLALAISVAATAASAAANTGKGNFARADANKDGALTRAEACAGKTRHVCKHFDAMDANRDGAVTRAEVRAYKNAKRAAKGLPARP
jgi:EF hand